MLSTICYSKYSFVRKIISFRTKNKLLTNTKHFLPSYSSSIYICLEQIFRGTYDLSLTKQNRKFRRMDLHHKKGRQASERCTTIQKNDRSRRLCPEGDHQKDASHEVPHLQSVFNMIQGSNLKSQT